MSAAAVLLWCLALDTACLLGAVHLIAWVA